MERRQSGDSIDDNGAVAERRGCCSPIEGVKVSGDSVSLLLRRGDDCSICNDLSAGDLMSVFINHRHFLLKVVSHRPGLREGDDGVHVVTGQRVESF